MIPVSFLLQATSSTILVTSDSPLILLASDVAAASARAPQECIAVTASAFPKENEGPTFPLEVHTEIPLDAFKEKLIPFRKLTRQLFMDVKSFRQFIERVDY